MFFSAVPNEIIFASTKTIKFLHSIDCLSVVIVVFIFYSGRLKRVKIDAFPRIRFSLFNSFVSSTSRASIATSNHWIVLQFNATVRKRCEIRACRVISVPNTRLSSGTNTAVRLSTIECVVVKPGRPYSFPQKPVTDVVKNTRIYAESAPVGRPTGSVRFRVQHRLFTGVRTAWETFPGLVRDFFITIRKKYLKKKRLRAFIRVKSFTIDNSQTAISTDVRSSGGGTGKVDRSPYQNRGCLLTENRNAVSFQVW